MNRFYSFIELITLLIAILSCIAVMAACFDKNGYGLVISAISAIASTYTSLVMRGKRGFIKKTGKTHG